MSAEPLWLAGADAELEDELRAIGIEITSLADRSAAKLPTETDGIDAAASQMLRMIGDDEAELDRISNARDAEVKLIDARYLELARPVSKRRDQKVQIIESIALQAGFDKAKKKSRATPYGTFGIRHQPERFEIIDQALALAAARAKAQSLISYSNPTPQARISQKDAEAYFSTLTLGWSAEKRDAQLAEFSCRIVPAHDKPFYKLAGESE